MQNGFRVLSFNSPSEARLSQAVLASYDVESRRVEQGESQLEVKADDLARIYEVLPDQRPPQELKPLHVLLPQRKQFWRELAHTLTLGLWEKKLPLLPAPEPPSSKENELR